MHKRSIHHFYRAIKPVSYWYFLIALIITGTVAVFALRDNNLTAIKLHDNLTQVDKENGNVNAALNQLREYIYSHMNTNLATPGGIYPPIQLKYTYQRLETAAQAKANAINEPLYTEAENYCQAVIPEGSNGFSGRVRVPCIENYVTAHGVKAQTISPALYEFDFVSPFWSPDLAGWSIVASIIFLILFVVRFALEKWLNYRLKHHA